MGAFRGWMIWLLICLDGPTCVATTQVPDKEALLRLHQQLLESVFLRSDPCLLAAAALPNLLVVPPGGVVENREQVLNGVSNLAADSLHIDEVTVVDHGTTAVVLARVRVSPRIGEPVGTGRSRMMSVFVHDQQKWRLLARSIRSNAPSLPAAANRPIGVTWRSPMTACERVLSQSLPTGVCSRRRRVRS